MGMTPTKFQELRAAKGEKVGGGFFVFRRGNAQNRVRFKLDKGKMVIPFEHPSEDSAVAEAIRLATKNPGQKYAVFKQVGLFLHPAKDASSEDETNHAPEAEADQRINARDDELSAG